MEKNQKNARETWFWWNSNIHFWFDRSFYWIAIIGYYRLVMALGFVAALDFCCFGDFDNFVCAYFVFDNPPKRPIMDAVPEEEREIEQ